MLFNQSPRSENVRGRRWPALVFAILAVGGMAVAAFHSSVRNAVAQDGKKSVEEIQEEALKALEALKNGPAPKKADDAKDLNPIDQMRRAEDALKKAQQDLKDNPKSEQARKAVEEASKKYQDSMRNSRPNIQVNPIAPINPEDLDKEIERYNREVQQMFQEMQRQMQMQMPGNLLMLPIQPGLPGRGGLAINRLPVRLGVDMRLGVRLEMPTAALSDQLDLPANSGLVVANVLADSAAATAGLKPNDVVLEIGGKTVASNLNEYQRLIREFKADEKVNLIIVRKGKKETLKDVKLPELKQEQVNPLRLNVPRIQAPNLNVAPQQGFGGRASGIFVTVNNGQFTIQAAEDDTKYTITGTKENGPAKVTSIEVDDNGKVSKAESVDKLDEKYRPTVERMIRNIK